jgi:tetratricopeptide (TPR) repeat protein
LQQTFDHIKAVTIPIPGAFFLDLFQRCYQFDQYKEGEKILKFAEERYPNDEEVLVGIAKGYLDLEEDNKALSILRRVLKNNPTHAEANIQVGILYFYMDQTRLAKRHWDRAQTQARKENDQLLLYRIKSIKDEFLHGKPLARSPIELLRNMPPEAREELFKDAPPEVAAALREMDLDMLEMMFNMGGFDDDIFDDDEDDFYYV